MFCKKCGEKIPGDSVFCQKCGEKQYSEKSNDTREDVKIDAKVDVMEDYKLPIKIGLTWPLEHNGSTVFKVVYHMDEKYLVSKGWDYHLSDLIFTYDFKSGEITSIGIEADAEDTQIMNEKGGFMKIIKDMRILEFHKKGNTVAAGTIMDDNSNILLRYSATNTRDDDFGFSELFPQGDFNKLVQTILDYFQTDKKSIKNGMDETRKAIAREILGEILGGE